MYYGRQLKFMEMIETRSEDYQEIQEDIVTILVKFLDWKRSSEWLKSGLFFVGLLLVPRP